MGPAILLIPQSPRGLHVFTQDLVISTWQLYGLMRKDSSDGFSLLWGHMGRVPVLQKGIVLYEVLSRWTCSEQFSKNVTPVHPNSFWQTVSL